MTDREETKVVVTDVRMPFWSMVVFLVKLTIEQVLTGLLICPAEEVDI